MDIPKICDLLKFNAYKVKNCDVQCCLLLKLTNKQLPLILKLSVFRVKLTFIEGKLIFISIFIKNIIIPTVYKFCTNHQDKTTTSALFEFC